MDKRYTTRTIGRSARPRSRRLREIGGASSTASASPVVVSTGGSPAVSETCGCDKHVHANKSHLDRLSTDDNRYLHISIFEEVEDESGNITHERVTAKAKAGHADNAEMWDNHGFGGYLDQPVRTTDAPQFASLTTDGDINVGGDALIESDAIVGGEVNAVGDITTAADIAAIGDVTATDIKARNKLKAAEADISGLATAAKVETADVQTASVHTEDFDPNIFSGHGFRLAQDPHSGRTSLHIDDLTVRGVMTIAELVVQEINTIGGMLVISAAAGEVESVSHTGTDDKVATATITLKDNGGKTGQFAVGDIVRWQAYAIGETITSRVGSAYVSAVSADRLTLTLSPNKPSTLATESDKLGTAASLPKAGDAIVQFGHVSDTARQTVVIINSQGGGEGMTICKVTSRASSGVSVLTRLGHLDGLTFRRGGDSVSLSGWGLYSDNVYLKGTFVLDTGEDVRTYIEAKAGEITARLTNRRDASPGRNLLLGTNVPGTLFGRAGFTDGSNVSWQKNFARWANVSIADEFGLGANHFGEGYPSPMLADYLAYPSFEHFPEVNPRQGYYAPSAWQYFAYPIRNELIRRGTKYTVSFDTDGGDLAFAVQICALTSRLPLTDRVECSCVRRADGSSTFHHVATLTATADGMSDHDRSNLPSDDDNRVARYLMLKPIGDHADSWTGQIFANLKVEVGDEDTPWTPAPEDIGGTLRESTLAEVRVTTDAITSTVASEIERVDGEINAVNSRIEQLPDAITSSVASEIDGQRQAAGVRITPAGVLIQAGKVAIYNGDFGDDTVPTALFVGGKIDSRLIEVVTLIAKDAHGNKVAAINDDYDHIGAYTIYWPNGQPRLRLSPEIIDVGGVDTPTVMQYYNEDGTLVWWAGASGIVSPELPYDWTVERWAAIEDENNAYDADYIGTDAAYYIFHSSSPDPVGDGTAYSGHDGEMHMSKTLSADSLVADGKLYAATAVHHPALSVASNDLIGASGGSGQQIAEYYSRDYVEIVNGRITAHGSIICDN